MIDILLNLPGRQALAGLGHEFAILPDDDGHPLPFVADGVNIHEIGRHAREAPGGGLVEVDGWWVMLRADDGWQLPESLLPHVVQPDPANPAIPNRVWA